MKPICLNNYIFVLGLHIQMKWSERSRETFYTDDTKLLILYIKVKNTPIYKSNQQNQDIDLRVQQLQFYCETFLVEVNSINSCKE